MSSLKSVRFPCPKCGSSRSDLNAKCSECDWSPETIHVPVEPKPKPPSQLTAAFVGFLTILPILYIIFFFTVILTTIMGNGGPTPGSLFLLFLMQFGMIVLSWCLIGYYIYYLFKTHYVKQDQKALWAVVLFLGGIVAMPIFWYLYIWKPAVETP